MCSFPSSDFGNGVWEPNINPCTSLVNEGKRAFIVWIHVWHMKSIVWMKDHCCQPRSFDDDAQLMCERKDLFLKLTLYEVLIIHHFCIVLVLAVLWVGHYYYFRRVSWSEHYVSSLFLSLVNMILFIYIPYISIFIFHIPRQSPVTSYNSTS